ncbi:DUF6174 domain-containing protein [Streptomyces sp. GXMU-J15]|uniref:DUF6174 domain-containing protein n=1 Tax=Streptomyces fuscus TaxID=3048495 RepID=A0ABT7J0T9_9ACTN|nr:DUF6174 domain-containing protein [Streptomyces fuscus]MDL2078457.1 DUF6174 domain-containing protein [Streptomyces fuscus]
MTRAPRRTRTASAVALGGALLLAAVGCGGESGIGVRTAEEPPAWQEPAAYSYTLESMAGERSLLGKFRITVRDGEVAEATGLDASGLRVVRHMPEHVPTIGDLLAELRRARKDGADRAEAEYAADGHPERIVLDPREGAIDDEAVYVISGYEEAKAG